MKYTINNKLVDFTNLKIIGSGAEAQVYQLDNKTVAKLYKQPNDFTLKAEQEAAKNRIAVQQTKLAEIPRNISDGVITPDDFIMNGKSIAGYTMRFIPGSDALYSYGERSFHDKGISNNNVIVLLRDLRSSVDLLHKKNIVIGDFNDLNVLVSSLKTYIIDTDSFQFGRYLCNMYTGKFLDPLLCDAKSNTVSMTKPHNQDTDWYAYAVMVMQSLLCVAPYDGVYIGKSKIPHPLRPLYRITVFNDNVRYPKSAYHYSILSDDILQYFHETFEKDKRIPFPEQILLDISFKICYSCGVEHTRSVCPICNTILPGITREKLTIKDDVTARRIFHTDGTILYASFQNEKLWYLYNENNVYRRDGDRDIIRGTINQNMRYRIQCSRTILAADNKMVELVPGIDMRSFTPVDMFGSLPIIDANSHYVYWVSNGELLREGKFGEPEKIGDVARDNTLFWVSDDLGFGFYRTGQAIVYFVFNPSENGINDSVLVSQVNGQIIDTTCVFSEKTIWFFMSYKDGSDILNKCFVIDERGNIVAQHTTKARDGSWLGEIRGKTAHKNKLFSSTDNGIVRLSVENGKILEDAVFPNTEPFVDSRSYLFVSKDGIYAVNKNDIVLLTMRT